MYRDETCQEMLHLFDLLPTTVATRFSNYFAPGEAVKHRRDHPFGFVVDVNPSAGRLRQLIYLDANDQDTLTKWLEAFSTIGGSSLAHQCRSCGGKGTDMLGQPCACGIGKACLRAGSNSKEAAMRISIMSARGLRSSDSMAGQGKLEPYCICEISNRPSAKLKTQSVTDTSDPIWDYHGELPGFRPHDFLYFQVYHSDLCSCDQLLGVARLESKSVLSRGFWGEIELEVDGKPSSAFLQVMVKSTWKHVYRQKHVAFLEWKNAADVEHASQGESVSPREL